MPEQLSLDQLVFMNSRDKGMEIAKSVIDRTQTDTNIYDIEECKRCIQQYHEVRKIPIPSHIQTTLKTNKITPRLKGLYAGIMKQTVLEEEAKIHTTRIFYTTINDKVALTNFQQKNRVEQTKEYDALREQYFIK